MIDNIPVIELTNENGNVSVKARNNVRTSAVNGIARAFAQFGDGVVATKEGFSLLLGKDKRTDKPIWVNVALTISMKEPEALPKK